MSDRIDRLREPARRAAARHEPRQRPLPDRLRQLERRAARRADADARSSPTSATSRRHGRSRASRSVQTQRDADRASSPSSSRAGSASRPNALTVARCRALARGRDRARAAQRASSRRCAPSRTRASSRRSGALPRSRRRSSGSWRGPFVGRTERDVAWGIEQLFHEHGADELAFESIVGSGPTGAQPHAAPATGVIEPGELVVVDIGCRVDGYCSDCTRTFATGELAGRAREAYDVVPRGAAGRASPRSGRA